MIRIPRRSVLALSCWLLAGTFAAAPFGVRDAKASVDQSLSIADLARASVAIAIITPLETRSEWESGRIVTFTHVRVDALVAGELASTEPVVRTLGGFVGTISQLVEGEPVLSVGTQSLVFLQRTSNGSLRIVGRGQGHFHVVRDTIGRATLVCNRLLGKLIVLNVQQKREEIAVVALHGTRVERGIDMLKMAWENAHAH